MKYTLRHIRTGTEIEKSQDEIEKMGVSLDKLERDGMLELSHMPQFLIICHQEQTFSVSRKVSFNKGGTGGITAKIGLPIEMLRAIGVDKESPQIKIKFERGEIKITRA